MSHTTRLIWIVLLGRVPSVTHRECATDGWATSKNVIGIRPPENQNFTGNTLSWSIVQHFLASLWQC